MLLNRKWELELPTYRHDQWEKPWEPERLEALNTKVVQECVVYDVGAEEGDITALMASWGAVTIPIEPSPYFWPGIKRIFDMNDLDIGGYYVGFASDRTVVNQPDFDFTDKDGWPACAYGKQRTGFRHLSQETDVTPEITLDDLAERTTSPDIINIDVEGSELKVLQGADKILTEWMPTVFVSIHPNILDEWYGSKPKDIHDLMTSYGYKRTKLAVDHEEHWMYE